MYLNLLGIITEKTAEDYMAIKNGKYMLYFFLICY